METNQDMLKMMERLEKSNRQQVRYARVQCLFSIIAAVCCLTLLLAVIGVIPQVQQVADQTQVLAARAEIVLNNLEAVTDELAEVDLGSMVSNVDSLVSGSQTGIEQALEKVNAIDIDTLNQTIKNLSDVVEPLARFFSSFS